MKSKAVLLGIVFAALMVPPPMPEAFLKKQEMRAGARRNGYRPSLRSPKKKPMSRTV
jgi:hypothetical protein